jgi:hypothetical protein
MLDLHNLVSKVRAWSTFELAGLGALIVRKGVEGKRGEDPIVSFAKPSAVIDNRIPMSSTVVTPGACLGS